MPDNNHRYSLEELFGLSTPNTDVDTSAPIGTREAPLTSTAPIVDVMENTTVKPAAGELPKLPETPISGTLEYNERAGRAAVSQRLANLQQDIKAPTLKPAAVNPTLSKTDNPLEEMLRGAFDMRKYVKEHLDEGAAEEDKAREDAFRKALESRTAKREFLSEEDIEPYKVSWPLDSGEQLVEYQIGGDTLPEEVAKKYLTSYNDELLHEKRFRDDEEYRNDWFLQHTGITDKQYRENLADELDKELDKWEEQVKPTVVQNTRGGYAALGAAANQQQNSSYQIARKKLDDARAKVNTLRKNNFWSGLREGADLAAILTFDLSSIGDNLKLMKALDKEMNGEPLTKNEEALIKAWEIDQKTEEAVEMLGGRSWSANVGYGVGYSLPYIPQLMLTGGVASAATKGISSAAAKAALKKSLATTTNRKIAEGLKLGALKVAENTVGSAARTPFMGMTYKDFTNRRLEHYSLESIVDGATGEVKQYISKEDSSALRDAFLSYGTTMSGVFSEGVGDWLSYGIKAAAKSLPRKNILRALAVDGISGPVKNPTMLWLKRASKINGVLVETAEEAIDDITTNVIAGDEDGWKRMATGQYWWELFCVSAILSGSFGAAYHGTNLFSTERKSRRALEKARLYSLDGIQDESLRKYLFQASMLDDLTDRSKMLANIDWESGYTREDMARAVDFITAQTSLDAMYYSEAEADRLRRMMPALAKIDQAANDKELNTDDLAEILGDTYAKAFRTQENQQDLNRIADRVRVAANAGISARDINDILAQAGLKVYAPGDEVETLAGVRGMVNNVLPGAYEIIYGNGNIGVFSFEEVLQPSKEVAEAQMANAGQEVAAEEQVQNAQPDAAQQAVTEAVEAARVEAEGIKNLDDDMVYDATMTDGSPVHIIKGSNIIYDEANGSIDYEASDDTVVVQFKDGSRKQVSIRDIDSIDEAITVDEMANLAGEAALAAAEAAQAQEVATEAQPIVEQTAVEGEQQAVQAPEQTNVQPEQVAEQTVAPKPAIPTLKNGQPDYNAMTPEQFVEVFGAQHGENAVVQIANNNVKAAEKKIADIEKKQSSLTDPNDFAKNASQLEEAKALKAKYEKVLDIVSQRNASPQVAEEAAQTAEQTVEPTEVAEAVEAVETPTAEVGQTAPTQEEAETEEPTAEVAEEAASTEEPNATVEEGSRFEGITAEEQALFGKMAKALNVAVEYVDEINGGRANAEYVPSTRTLRVARGGRDKAARFLVGHEFTHRMQALAPQQYEEFAQAVVDYLGAEFNIRVKHLREVYKAHKIKANTQLLRDEVVADFAGELAENRMLFDGFVNTDAVKNNPGLLERIMEVLRAIRDYFVENNASNPALDEAIGKLEALYSASVEAANSIESEGGQVDMEKGDALSSVKDILQDKQREKAIKDLMRVTGRSRATVERYLKAEESLAAIILDANNNHILDLPADDSLPSIWKNSDYPQGTVEFSNICRKRLPLTMLYQRLQKEFPLMVFDKYAIETMRGVLKANGVDVACGICFVEDRRQLLGEIGQMFIDMLEGNFTEANEKQNAAFEEMKASWDGYIPTLYDLLTLDGYKALKAKHPAVATAFLKFNNARGMQAGRLFQAYSAYHREILGYSKATVRSKNNNGGLRIFSFSDFEAHHLIDLVQILTDCAAKGLKVQGYTKVPEFARAVKDTNMKVNRSLISKGNGVVDANYVPGENEAVSPNAIGGKRLLLDTVEGIDVNHRDFFDSTDSKSVGNILVGINEEQIRLAMLDPFVDYIIPFHTGLSASVLKQKGIGEWVNYKNSQIEKVEVDGKLKNAPGHGINIYEEVLSDDIKTERQFVNRYLEVCREKGYIPKFPQFLSKNSKGKYIYTKGYYKFLIDFKLFDKNGKIIPQEAIVPVFDNELNKQILEDYVRDEKAKLPNEELYDKVKEALGLPTLYSLKMQPEKKVTFDDFFENTAAVYVAQEQAPEGTPNYTSPSGSRYWYGEDEQGKYVIRRSDHWSDRMTSDEAIDSFESNPGRYRNIASCYWGIDTRPIQKTLSEVSASDIRRVNYNSSYHILNITFRDGGSRQIRGVEPSAMRAYYESVKLGDMEGAKMVVEEVVNQERNLAIQTPIVIYGKAYLSDFTKFERENTTQYSLKESNKAALGKRSDADSHNSLSEGLPLAGSERLSDMVLTPPEDFAKIMNSTERAKITATKLINEGGFKQAIETPSQAVSSIGRTLHMKKSKSSQSYYGDYFEGDYTVEGNIVHLRVSTHPAAAYRIGNKRADHKVSIVVLKNGEHKNSQEPHGGYEEFIYDPSKVKPSEAAEAIVVGIKSLLETGVYTDVTGKAIRKPYPYTNENGEVFYSIKEDGRASFLENQADDAARAYVNEQMDIINKMDTARLGERAYSFERMLARGGSERDLRAYETLTEYAREAIAERPDKYEAHEYNLKDGEHGVEILDELFHEFNTSKETEQLFSYVYPAAKRLGISVRVQPMRNWGEHYQGIVALNGGFFNSDIVPDSRKAEVILHELIHSVTTNAIYFVENPSWQSHFMFQPNENLKAAVKNIKDIYNDIAKSEEFEDEYGVKNVHEFMAELSNPQFVEKLKKHNLWTEIVDAIKRIVSAFVPGGIYSSSNAHKEAMDALEKIVENMPSEKQVAVNYYWQKKRPYEAMNSSQYSLKGDAVERAKIERTAKANGTWLKAPNGKQTNLPSEQWVTTRTKAFKNWAGDWENDPENATKILDENGEPKIVYHQTNATAYINRETGQNWDELDWRERMEWEERDDWGDYWEEQDFYTFTRVNARTTNEFDGFFFAPEYDEHHEYGNRTIAAFLNIRKPASRKDYNIDSAYNNAGREERIRLQNEGFDGVIREYDGAVDEYIAFEPNQIKLAEGNATFDPNNDDTRYSLKGSAPMFYSNAFNAVKGISQEKATPEQWLKMIEKSGGLKAGEDKWIGLSDWLKGSDKKTLTKQEVLDYIAQNEIQVEEVKYAEENSMVKTIKESPEFAALRKEYLDLKAEIKDEAETKLREKYGPDFDIAFSVFGDLFVKDDEAAAKLLGIPYENADLPIQGSRLIYSTQGLTNKREIALTVPTIEPWNEGDQIHFGDAGEGRAVAWIRFGETTDSDGKRVLVIDEIQSKRHQEGRERGYATDVTEEQVKKAREEADVAFRMLESFDEQMAQKYGTRFWSDQGTNEEYAHWELLRSGYDHYGRIYEELYDKRSKAIPAAPFEKNWAELAMKRMLRYAAENGYEKVAWTKGDQQAERYNIGSVVQRITSYEDGGNRMVIIRLNNNEPLNLKVDSEGKIVSSNREIGANTLSDVVGKELAVKIMNNEGEDATYYDGGDIPAKVIAGEGLRIGGEGMKGFYDQILPSFMNKYGKKWGVKVQDVTLPFVEEAGRTMHSVDVADAMRESVMEGQPLFSLKSNVETEESADIEVGENIDAGPSQSIIESEKAQRALTRLNKVVRQFRTKLNKVAKENLDWGTSVATALEKEVGSGELLSFLEMADFISNIRGAISEKSVDKALETLSDKVLTKLIAERKKNLKQLMEVEVQRTTPAGIPIAHGVDNATRQVVDTFNILKKLGPEQARKHMEEISDKDMPGHLKAEVMQLHTLWMLIQDEETNLEVLKQKLDRAHEESVSWYRTARALKGLKGREKEREEALAMRRTHIAEIRRIEPLMTATKQQLADDYASIVEQFADRIMVGRAAQKRKIDEERKYAQRFGIEALKDVDTGRARKTYEYSAEEKREKKKDERLRDIRLSMHGSLKYMIESVSTNAIGGRGFIYHEMILGDNGWVACRDNELQMNLDCNLEILKRANTAGFKTVDDMRRAFDDRLLLHDGTQAVVTYMTERTGAQKVEKVPLTVGNATYLVLMWNQPDIRPTLERMNIDEETIMELHEMLPAYAKNFIEWSVDMLEERLEKVYSPASVQMYGTSMDKNLNYFPVRRVKEDTYHAPVDITDPNVAPDDNKKVVNTSTALIRRKANLVSVQILVNPMEVLGKHLEEMNHFATFVPFTRNANILLSAPGFREQLDMQDEWGHGLNTYDNFKQAVLVAAGNYQPATDKISKVLNEVQGLVAAGKIAWRFFTAAKQILSLPAFASYSTDPKYWKIFTKNILTTAWWKRGESGRMSTWKWCYENLPTYKQRWDSKYAGDEKLSTVEATAMARALDRSMAGRAIKDFFGKYGMLANAAVDAFTCSIGAYSIYEYELQRYQNEEGMSKEEADKMAKRRAEIGFNQSQQSSELLFLAPSQLDKTFAATYASLFENSNRAYGRIERVGREQIVRSFDKNAVAKQLDLAKNRYAKKLRDAERARLKAENEKISDFSKRLTEEQIEKAVNEKRAAFDIQAEKMAKRDMNRAKKNAVADVVVFRYLLNILWSISPSLAQSVAFIGSDDDENPESWDWAFWANNILQAHLRNGVGGATIGSILSGFGAQSMLEADLNKLIDTAMGIGVKIDEDGEEKTTIDWQAFWETAKLVYAMGTGINLETFSNMYNAVCMVINDGSLDAEDVALFLNSPKSIIEAAAIRPDEGESQEDYIKRIAFMKGLASKVETAQKKQEMNSEGIVEELTDAEKSALTNLKKWQKNYIDIKTARALGLQWQRNRYNGRVEIPELTKLDKQYKHMLKMLGRTPSLNKVEKEKRYIYPEDVQSRIDEAVERLDVMKRLRNIRGLEQGRELNVVKNNDYEALTRQWYDAKKSLVEDWKNYQIK